jgi:hypothetical protein
MGVLLLERCAQAIDTVRAIGEQSNPQRKRLGGQWRNG